MVLRANGFGLLFNVVVPRANPEAARHHALSERSPCLQYAQLPANNWPLTNLDGPELP
jgi:hypothetical protein